MRKPDAEEVEVLKYLHDLGWTELYKEPPGASVDFAGEPEASRNESALSHVAATPGPDLEAAVESSSSPAARHERTPTKATPASDVAGDRRSHLALLEERALGCTACKLSAGRHKVVFGTGNPDADLMFIGEGPGAHEDRQGLPFVGPAGELLTKIIGAIDLSRDEVYIANMVKCRPPNNRDPEPDEVMACRPFLEQQIELIQPKVIVALGRVAAQTLLESDRSLGKMRGEWFLVQGVETRVTYHPAALLRNASFKRPVWEDMQLVRDRLKELA